MCGSNMRALWWRLINWFCCTVLVRCCLVGQHATLVVPLDLLVLLYCSGVLLVCRHTKVTCCFCCCKMRRVSSLWTSVPVSCAWPWAVARGKMLTAMIHQVCCQPAVTTFNSSVPTATSTTQLSTTQPKWLNSASIVLQVCLPAHLQPISVSSALAPNPEQLLLKPISRRLHPQHETAAGRCPHTRYPRVLLPLLLCAAA